jgi:hypothetical protein
VSWFLRLLVPCGATGRSNAETQRARKGAQVISHPLLIAISDPRLRISPQLIAITGSTAAKQFATDREQENPDPEQFATDPEQGEPDPEQSATDHEQG